MLVTAIGEADNFDASASADSIIMAADNLPFLTEQRLVKVQFSKLFVSGRKTDAEIMAEYLPKIPDSTILIFMEADIDRRGRLYKRVAEIGAVVECETPTPQVLNTWLQRQFKKWGKSIDHTAASLLLRYSAHNMTTLVQETEKLVAYVGQSSQITTHDIQAICSPTLQIRVFDLIGAMGNAQTGQALNMYRNMLLMKEQPLMILAMIIRQFRIILQVKSAQTKGMTKQQMTKNLGLKSFVIDEALSHGRRFSMEQVLGALVECQNTDFYFKSGLYSAEIGVELLIMQYTQVG